MHHLAGRSAILFSLWMFGCGGARTEPAAVEETSLIQASSDEAPAETVPAPVANASVLHPGEIRRDDLSAILAKGPGAVLALVETEPFRQNGRFEGFTIVRFKEGPPAAVDLKEGDVFQSVNGLRIVSPDDYFRAFQELRVASELRFDILRDGAPRTLTYKLVE